MLSLLIRSDIKARRREKFFFAQLQRCLLSGWHKKFTKISKRHYLQRDLLYKIIPGYRPEMLLLPSEKF